MNADEVIDRLTKGQELRNHGSGWWIAPPRKPYAPFSGQQVSDEIVDGLEKAGKIKISIPHTSAVATLV